MTLHELRGAPMSVTVLGLAAAFVLLIMPTSAPAPGDHENMRCGSVISPIRRNLSQIEPTYRQDVVERCASTRTDRTVWAVVAFGAALGVASMIIYGRRHPAERPWFEDVAGGDRDSATG